MRNIHLYDHICVVGKKETILPLVDEIELLYHRLLDLEQSNLSAVPNKYRFSLEIKKQLCYTCYIISRKDATDRRLARY